MLKKILIAVAVLVAIFVGVVVMQPATYHVERTLGMNAPDSVIYANIDDFRAWADWSPWEKLDPNMKKTYSGPERGVGHGYAWEGSDEVGKGKMTILESSPSSAISIKLEFIEPFASVATSGFELAPEGEGKSTNVTWWMDGENNFMGKAFGLFMDMDKMIGADFEKGLASLKAISEAEAKKLEAAAKAAPPAAVPPPAAPAAPAPGASADATPTP
jgi:hypothetical protein